MDINLIPSLATSLRTSPFFDRCTSKAALKIVSTLAGAALATLALLYLNREKDIVIFDSWKVKLGWGKRATLLPEEIANLDLAALAEKYSPKELIERLYAYICSQKVIVAPPAPPKQPKEWLDWIVGNSKKNLELDRHAKHVIWEYESSTELPEEEQQVLFVQSWMASLQRLSLLVGVTASSLTDDVFQSIISSPRFAYTILFNLTAPYAADRVWESIKNYFPNSVKAVGDAYIDHKGKIALAMLGLLALLYYRMSKEKGVLTDLTSHWRNLRGSHQGCDLVPHFNDMIHKFLCCIGKKNPKDKASSILSYHHKDTHGTFGGKLGDILAEITATGRTHDQGRDSEAYPYLKDLKIWRLDLEAFVTQHRDSESIHTGWLKLMAKIAAEGNVLVVVDQFHIIAEALGVFNLFDPASIDERGSRQMRSNSPEASTDKLLARLFSTSLRNGEMRCLIEVDEEVEPVIKRSGIGDKFHSLRSPTIPINEILPYLERQFCHQETGVAVDQSELQQWLLRLTPTLKGVPTNPENLTSCIEQAVFLKDEKIRHKALHNVKGDDAVDENVHANAKQLSLEKFKALTDATKRLADIRSLKGKLLQQIWKMRGMQQQSPLVLTKALLLIQHVVLPFFKKQVLKAKMSLNEGKPIKYIDEMIVTVQRLTQSLCGAATPAELERLKTIPERLTKKIKGQSIALHAIGQAVTNWRKVPFDDDKPLVMMFAGPPGVGKSDTATQLAYELNDVFGIAEEATPKDEHNVMRVQLARNTQGEGYGEGWSKLRDDILAQIARHPCSVIILEEWDKMPIDQRASLFEFFDTIPVYRTRYMPQGEGQYINRSSTIFILTSNIAENSLAELSKENLLPDQRMKKAQEFILNGIEENYKDKGLTPFLSRVKNCLIPFFNPTQESMREIVEMHLDKYVASQALTQEMRAQVSEALVAKLIDKTYDVRDLGSVIHKEVCAHVQ